MWVTVCGVLWAMKFCLVKATIRNIMVRGFTIISQMSARLEMLITILRVPTLSLIAIGILWLISNWIYIYNGYIYWSIVCRTPQSEHNINDSSTQFTQIKCTYLPGAQVLIFSFYLDFLFFDCLSSIPEGIR